MKTKKLLLALLLTVSATMSWALTISGVTGTGIVSDPFLIASSANLSACKTAINANTPAGVAAAYYKLTSDVSMSGTANFYGGIGTFVIPFTGNFDGNGFKVTGLTAGTSVGSPLLTTGAVGFFGYVMGATISSLEVDANLYVTYSTSVATSGVICSGLIGSIAAGTATTVKNCKVTGVIYGETLASSSIAGRATAGGIVGTCSNATIVNCTVDASITAKNDYTAGTSFAAGIIGQLWNTAAATNVVNCSAAGAVVSTSLSGYSSAAGIVSQYSSSTSPIVKILNCMATNTISSTGTVSATTYNHIPVAGIAQCFNANNVIKYCIALNPSMTQTNTSTGPLGYYANRIYSGTAFVPTDSLNFNYALSTMAVTRSVNGAPASAVTLSAKTVSGNDGADVLAADAVAKLNAYVSANPTYSGIALTTWLDLPTSVSNPTATKSLSYSVVNGVLKVNEVEGTLSIYSITGQLIKKAIVSGSFSIALSKGVYIVKLDGISPAKVVVE